MPIVHGIGSILVAQFEGAGLTLESKGNLFEIDNTRKHYIPRFYLRGFSRKDKRGQIYLFDKKAPDKGIQSRSIENVEVSKAAYSVHIDDFNRQMESRWAPLLTHLNTDGATELNKLVADRERSATLRAELADFTTSMSLRSRGFRERMKETSLENWHSLRREINRIFEEMDDEELLKETGVPKEEIRRGLATFTHTDDYAKWIAVTMRPYLPEGNKFNKLLEEGTWRFENPPSPRRLILSDIPSTILRLGPEYPDWIHFQVPINETLLLIGQCGDARLESGLLPGYTQMSEEKIDLTNAVALEHAEQHVYSSSKDEIERQLAKFS